MTTAKLLSETSRLSIYPNYQGGPQPYHILALYNVIIKETYISQQILMKSHKKKYS